MLIRIGTLTVVTGTLTFGDIAQIVGLSIVLIGVLAVGRVRQKDSTIHDLDQALKGKEERLEETEAQLEGAAARADEEHDKRREAEKTVARLEGELVEVRRYTARGALGELKETLERLAEQASARNATMTERQERVEKAVIAAIEAQGELVLKNTELLARLLQHLAERTGGLNAAADVRHPDVT